MISSDLLGKVFQLCSGDQVMVSVQLEREDEEEVSPYVMAPFFPQVSSVGVFVLSEHLFVFTMLTCV